MSEAEGQLYDRCAVCGWGKLHHGSPYPFTVIPLCEPCFVGRTEEAADAILSTPGEEPVTVRVMARD